MSVVIIVVGVVLVVAGIALWVTREKSPVIPVATKGEDKPNPGDKNVK